MRKSKPIFPSISPDDLEGSQSIPAPTPSVKMVGSNFPGTTIIVQGKSGNTYRFERNIPVAVVIEDIPDLLARTRNYTPCCTGERKIIPIFFEISNLSESDK